MPDALVELAGLTPRRHLDGVPQLGDIWDGYRLVHDAVLDFGAGLTAEQISRDQAAGILRLTAIWERLSERERAAVLRRFPQHIDSRDLQDS